MRDPIILRRQDTLTPAEARYWKDLLYRTAKIGAELEVAPPKGVKRARFEAAVQEDLRPSGDLHCLGANGVLDVSPEHCGIEIRVIGRHPHFTRLQQQYGAIMAALADHGARARATCGLHFHLLTPDLAEPVPEIILANMWNLVRRYAPELKFITSGGDSRAALCRRRNHNSHLEMVRHSPATMPMAEIQALLKASQMVPEHQNFLNLEHLAFTVPSNPDLPAAVQPFHLEFRFPDSDLAATSVTAKTFLFNALLLKAVDLSQYGVIHVGKIQSWRRKIALLDLLSNNAGRLASSDTRAVDDAVVAELQQGALELLDLLTPVFENFIDNPALEVLLVLAETPVSLLRCAGYTWPEIEANLAARAAVDEVGLDRVDCRLMQRIELGEWAALPSADAWRWHAARELLLTPPELEHRLTRLHGLRGLRWSERQGTMVFTS